MSDWIDDTRKALMIDFTGEGELAFVNYHVLEALEASEQFEREDDADLQCMYKTREIEKLIRFAIGYAKSAGHALPKSAFDDYKLHVCSEIERRSTCGFIFRTHGDFNADLFAIRQWSLSEYYSTVADDLTDDGRG